MCGRFALTYVHGFWSRFSIRDPPSFELVARFNIAPTQLVPIVIGHPTTKAIMMSWGLIPFWAKDPRIGNKMINARAETVQTKPAFRASLKRRRCIVPATGFYEWRKGDGKKTPFFVHLKDNSMFGFAGLYDNWKGPEDEMVTSFTIITTGPNSMMEKIHNRMPVILREEHEALWLKDEPLEEETLRKAFSPYPAARMAAHIVSREVNSPAIDSEHLIEPVEPVTED